MMLHVPPRLGLQRQTSNAKHFNALVLPLKLIQFFLCNFKSPWRTLGESISGSYQETVCSSLQHDAQSSSPDTNTSPTQHSVSQQDPPSSVHEAWASRPSTSPSINCGASSQRTQSEALHLQYLANIACFSNIQPPCKAAQPKAFPAELSPTPISARNLRR